MDDIDRRLLNIIQTDFPIDSEPYRILGERLGISGAEALERTVRLRDDGIIRKIGPTFNTAGIGHASVLVAARVPEDRLEEVAAAVSRFQQVTHNYGRDFEYNLWFTLVCSSSEELSQVLDAIRTATGIEDMCALPAIRMFKINVRFDF